MGHYARRPGEPRVEIEVYRVSAAHPHSVLGSIASFFARSDCPCLFAVNAHGAGRLISGILRRWEERVAAEAGAAR
jgi:hypothetical protein